MNNRQFEPIPNRDACDALIGYGYQVDLSILRWLRLDDHEMLELEVGEDVDLLVGLSPEQPQEVYRRLEQVKKLKGRITLRSPATVVAFLANSVFHSLSNPNLQLRFLFTTTASVGMERPSLMPAGISGLQAWDLLRKAKSSSIYETNLLGDLRSTLRSQARPPHVSDDVWETYKKFVEASEDDELQDFVRRTEWCTAQSSPGELLVEIFDSLVGLGYCVDLEHAKQTYDCLFAYVFRVLTKRPPRRLRPRGIARLAKLPALSSSDRSILKLIGIARLQIEELTKHVSQMDLRVSAIESQLRKRVAVETGITVDSIWERDVRIRLTDPPPRVALAVNRSSSVGKLIDAMDECRWLNLHGGPGTGKTQLLVELLQELDSEVFWSSMKDLDVPHASMVVRALSRTFPEFTKQAKSEVLVVLEDLPVSPPSEGLATAVADLSAAVADRGWILTTTYSPIPQVVRERLEHGVLADMSVPGFDTAATMELFRVHGAPHDAISEFDVASLTAAAAGHPVLLVAVARLLAKRKWEIGENGLNGVLGELKTEDITDQLCVRFMQELEDEDTRELLYRLALVTGDFDSDQVSLLAEDIIPVIPRAGERLVDATGFWVERRPQGRFAISPLLAPVARHVLDTRRQAAINDALATDMLGRTLQGVPDVFKVIGYLLQAKSEVKAVWVIAESIRRAIGEHADSLRLLLPLAASELVRNLDLPLPLSVYLLGQRFRAFKYLGQDVATLVGEVTAISSAVGDSEAWVLPLLAVNSLPGLAKADFEAAMKLVEEALQHLGSVRKLLTSEPEANTADLGAVLVWGLSTGVDSPERLRSWVDLLASCETNVRDAALSFPNSEMGLSGLLDSTVHVCSSKKGTWKTLEDTLGYIQSLSEEPGLRILDGCAKRARFILRSEITDTPTKALADAAMWVEGGQMLPEGEYALQDAVSGYLLDTGQTEEGMTLLSNAVKLETQAYPMLRWRAHIRLAAVSYKFHGVVEQDLLEKSLSIAQENQEFCLPLSTERAQGELGIAEWLQGHARGVFAYFESAVTSLLRAREGTPEWKSTFVLMAHALGYIAADVALQSPDQRLPNGQPFVAPSIGHFLSNHDELPGLFRADRVPNMFYLMSMLASSVGEREAAGKWAVEALERARELGLIEIIATSAKGALVPLLEADELSQAIGVSLEGSLALVLREWLDDDEYPPLEPIGNFSDLLAGLPADRRSAAEEEAVADGVLLAFLRAAKLKIMNDDRTDAAFDEVISACDGLRTVSSTPELWETASSIVQAAHDDQSHGEEILEIGRSSGSQEYNCLRALAYFAYSLAPDTKLPSVLIPQTLASHYVFERTAREGSLFIVSVLRFLEAFWTQAMNKQAFRFRTPPIAKEKLGEAMKIDERNRAQAILRVANEHLPAKLPEGAEESQEWLYGKGPGLVL